MRAYKSIVAKGCAAQQFAGMATWQLMTPDGNLLYRPRNLKITALYVDGVAVSILEYTNNVNSNNANTPSGSVTFASGFMPAPTSTVTWDGTADDYELTLAPTLLAQYSSSPSMVALLESMNLWIDDALDVDLLFNNIWNIYTANGIGLDIWGRIVGADRTIPLTITQTYFGFNEGSGSFAPFDNDPFYAGSTPFGLYTLTDDAYRVYILTKAFANICDMSIPSMNRLLNIMFAGRGSCYVLEVSALSIQYVFHFALQTWEKSIMLQAQLLPRPAGVEVSVVTP